MRKKLNASIKVKVLFLPLIMLFLTITVIASISIGISRDKILNQMKSDGINFANRISSDFEKNSIATDSLNESIEDKIRTLATFIIANKSSMTNDYLKVLAKQFKVDEINIADPSGKVPTSNLQSSIDSPPFNSKDAGYPVLKGEKQELMEKIRKSIDNGNYYKYGYLRDPNGGMVQIGILANNVKKLTNELESQTLINDIVKDKSIVYALFMDKNLKVQADSNKKEIGTTLKDKGSKTAISTGKVYSSQYKDNGTNVYDIIVPVHKDGQVVGAVDIGMSMKNVESTVYGTIAIIVLISLIVFILFLLIFIRISKGITLPLNNLVNVSKQIADGELNNKININNSDEIGLLANSFNNMAENLKDTISTIKKETLNVNSMSSELNSNSENMKSAANEVAKAIQDVAEGATEQSNNLMDISNVITEFAKDLDAMSAIIGAVNENANFTGDKVKEGSKEINILLKSIENVKEAFESVSNKFKDLDLSVSEVGKITEVIDGISEQTNLLALNAAIEAARAGEAGKGFAVVADEVRQLAEQSKESTKHIHDLIANISSETNAVMLTSNNVKEAFVNQAHAVKNAISSFDAIDASINNTAPLINTASNSIETIEKSKDIILNKIESLTAISEETSASSEEISASSEELYASSENVSNFANNLSVVANKLNDKVNKFKI